MVHCPVVADGLYRLVKWREDGIPVFPSSDTVVEVRAGKLVNLSTGRSWPLAGIGDARSLFGPLTSPYDCTQLKHLPRIDLAKPPRPDLTVPGIVSRGPRPRLIA